MPAKKHTLTDDERAKRIRETAREVEAHATREEFERAFKKVVPSANSVSGEHKSDKPR